MSLMSGERQVAATLAKVRGDHVARYRFAAAKLVGLGARLRGVLDAGCGVGYGAKVLAEAGLDIHAWDIDDESITYGRQHYEHPRIRMAALDVCAATCHQADAVVAFEILEHLQRPGLALIRFPDRLIASMPNASVIPKTESTYTHHVRHYTPAEFELLLAGAGYRVTEWWSQRDTSGAELVRGSNGRTIVAVAER